MKVYTKFVETVRKFEENEVEDPIEKAIDDCIKNHILEEFLRNRRMEVIKAMTIDMTFEKREALIREESLNEGEKKGKLVLVDELLKDGKISAEYANELRNKISKE